jgi:hypothetical protein
MALTERPIWDSDSMLFDELGAIVSSTSTKFLMYLEGTLSSGNWHWKSLRHLKKPNVNGHVMCKNVFLVLSGGYPPVIM